MITPTLTVTIVGEPVAQGRPRFRRMPKFVMTYDPAPSRSWKGAARVAMEAARPEGGALPFPAGPLDVEIEAVFSCPRGDYRKRDLMPRRPHHKRPDAENVAKAVLDAATGVIFRDDSQVAMLTVCKVIGRQGEAPYVRITVAAMLPAAKEVMGGY